MNTTQLVKQYVSSRSLAWSTTTVKSESARLANLAPYIDGNPDRLYSRLASECKPYTMVTAWTRVVAFYDYLLAVGAVQGHNPYRTFRITNSRLFKNKYQTKTVNKSFAEVKTIVESMPDGPARRICSALLFGGLRLHEVNKRTTLGVEGKGGKIRPYFGPDIGAPLYTQSDMSSARSALKRHGLTPHDLRRLCATELVSKGLKEADLLKVMGWSSILTAKSYLQPKRDAELQSIMSTLMEESGHAQQ